MAYPKPNIVPPGGFHYEETGLRIEGHSYQNVAEQLLRFRLDNKHPVGDPLADVMNYVCSRHPHFCTEPHAPAPLPKRPDLLARVTAWIASLYRNALKPDKSFVTQGQANSRAAVCAACPNNVEWRTGCGSCVESTSRLAFTYRAGRQADYEKKLLGCSIAGQDNATAVWLGAPSPLSPEEHAALPTHCWRK